MIYRIEYKPLVLPIKKKWCDMDKKTKLPKDDRFCQYWRKKQDVK